MKAVLLSEVRSGNMVLDRIKGRIAFICDECQDGLETDEFDLEDAVRSAKQDGWKNIKKEDWPYNPPKVKSGAKYFNICKSCYENKE